MTSRRVAFVPPVPALLPSYGGLADPVAELRAACLDATRWLVDDGPPDVAVLGDPVSTAEAARGVQRSLSLRVADELLDAVGHRGRRGTDPQQSPAWLVLANGSARRGEKAPGHLDDRAFGFDESLGKALAAGDAAGLADLDEQLATELLTAGSSALRSAGAGIRGRVRAETWFSGDPFGVQYWVVTWQCGS